MFSDTRFTYSNNIRVIACNVGITDGKHLRCCSVNITGAEIMKYATEMASGGIKCVPTFIKFGSGVQKTDNKADNKTDNKLIS
jgi:hypothetical protein